MGAETGIIRAYRSGNIAITIGRVTAESCPLLLQHHLAIYVCATDPFTTCRESPADAKWFIDIY